MFQIFFFFCTCLDKTVIFRCLLYMTFYLLSGAVKTLFFMEKLLKKGSFEFGKKKGLLYYFDCIKTCFLLYGRKNLFFFTRPVLRLKAIKK